MRLFKRSSNGVYYAEFERGRIRSLKTRDSREARVIYNALKQEYLAGRLRHITGRCNVTLCKFVDEFEDWASDAQKVKTYKANRLALRKLVFIAGDLPLDQLSQKHIDQLVSHCRSQGLSTSSINNYIRHARTSLNKAVEWEYLRTNPFHRAKEIRNPRKPPKFLDQKEVIHLLQSIKDMDLRRLVAAYLTTGRRRAELLALSWDDVNFERGVYYVKNSKRDLARFYPISNGFLGVLNSFPPDARKGRIFNRWGHPDTVTHQVKKALVKAGFPLLHLHHFRHSFASNFVESGGDLRTLQELLGQTDYRTTEIYAHLKEDHLKKEVNRVKFGPVDLFK